MASGEGDRPIGESLPAVDAVIVGAGFTGLYAHYRLRKLGLKLQGFEAAPDVVLERLSRRALRRPNVTLVDLRETPIERITPTGLRTSAQEYPLDVLVLATGFDAVTGPLLRLSLTGTGGARLEREWAHGPRSYLGLMVARFPNIFTVTGPGSPSVLSNMMPPIEQHVDWVADCLEYLRDRDLDRIEADPAAQEGWAAEVQAAAAHSLFLKANSWYMGANVAGKPRTILPYMGGFSNYAKRCAEMAQAGYRGFRLSREAATVK